MGKNYRRVTSLDQVTFEAGLNSPITFLNKSVPIDLNGALWYDLNGNGVQELSLKSIYSQQCWGIMFNFIKKTDEYQFILAIKFTGLGLFKLGSI